MNNGDGKDSLNFLSEKENHQSKRSRRKSPADEFAQAVARVAVAQICESRGFQSFNRCALDALTDIGIRYIREVGKAACSSANSANRSQCNVFDVIWGLEDLGSIQGFTSASDVSHSLSQSGIIKDMIRYVGRAVEIPFAYSVPSFPVIKKRKLDPSFAQVNEKPPDEHIPTWLPKLPDPEAFVELSSGRENSSNAETVNKTEQPRNQEVPTLNFPHKLLCNGSKVEGAVEEEDAGKTQRAVNSNPFLAPPVLFGEKELSLPVIPAKLVDEGLGNHRNCEVMENLELSLQGNGTERSESDGRRKVLVNGRPVIHFKFGNAKKPLGMVTSPQEKISLWFNDDQDGREEKKRTADRIHLENTESPPNISPL